MFEKVTRPVMNEIVELRVGGAATLGPKGLSSVFQSPSDRRKGR